MEDGRVIGLLWVARSLETLGVALDRLQAILIGVGLLALLSAGAWGWRLARSSLRPVDEMTRAASDIGHTQDFSRRVAYTGPPDEMGRLAATFNEMLASLEAAHQRTESALAAQRRFVADASHELRTPLTSLRGNAGILRHVLSQLPAGPADTAGILADMDDELARLSRLVDGLLTLARADAGQHITKAPVDLSEIVMSVFRQAQGWPSRIMLHLESQERVVVSGNADHLTQLLLILLDNAIAYTPPGGQVTLSLKREGDDAMLDVTDTGIGIDPGDLPHIFDRFYRGRAARVAKGDGSGLGLAIARWIVDEHGGQIAVRSEVGKGSSFTIKLPAVSPQQSGQPTPLEP
jgi:signal transduction histidine kinase